MRCTHQPVRPTQLPKADGTRLGQCAGGKERAAKLCQRGLLVQSAIVKFAAGHGPTDYARWVEAAEPYPVDYALVRGGAGSLGGSLGAAALVTAGREARQGPEGKSCASEVLTHAIAVGQGMHLQITGGLGPWRPYGGLTASAPGVCLCCQGYEPYTIMLRRHVPWFDERFRGYGFDKASVPHRGIVLKDDWG